MDTIRFHTDIPLAGASPLKVKSHKLHIAHVLKKFYTPLLKPFFKFTGNYFL